MEITLKCVEEQDESFLLNLYFDSHPELTSIPVLDDEAKEQLIRQQYLSEKYFLKTQYPDADLQVILLNGQPIGRLYVYRGQDVIRILAIALHSNYQGKGIGRSILNDILHEARAYKKVVRLQVFWYNVAARSLYQRLGFEVVQDLGVNCEMQWTP